MEAPPWVGGRLKYFKHNWAVICTDPWISQLLSGYALPFVTKLPLSSPSHQQINLTASQTQTLQDKISNLLQTQAIRLADPHLPGFYSQMFVVPKKDGGWHPIIKSEESQLLFMHTSLQAREHPEPEGCSSSERLYGKGGL